MLSVEAGPSRRLNEDKKGLINVTSGEVQDGLFLEFVKFKYIDVPEDLTRYYLQKDDIILNYVNSIKKIGKCALYRGEFSPVVIGHNVLRIKINRTISDPIFITQFMKTQYFMNQIRSITKPAVNQASFNMTDLRMCKVNLPPLPLQQKFARIVEKAEELREKQQRQMQEADNLFNALMQKAFTGELVE